MWNTIFNMLNDSLPSMLPVLLLALYLQAKLNREFGSLRKEMGGLRREMSDEFANVRKEMSDEFVQVRKEMTDGFADVRSEIGEVSKRAARIEGKLDLQPPCGGNQQPAE